MRTQNRPLEDTARIQRVVREADRTFFHFSKAMTDATLFVRQAVSLSPDSYQDFLVEWTAKIQESRGNS